MMVEFDRIRSDPKIMRGVPCIIGTRVTVASIVGMLASGHSRERILAGFPDLQAGDVDEALRYAAWRLTEQEVAATSE